METTLKLDSSYELILTSKHLNMSKNADHLQFNKIIVTRHWPLWKRFLNLPLKSSLRFIWNLLMMFQMVLPLNITSRIWGWVNSIELAVFLRIPIYSLYSWIYGCKLHEMLDPNLKNYKNLSEFFRRSIKPSCRPIKLNSSLVSPADGRVISLGPVTPGQIQNVKGICYTLHGFLGPSSWKETEKEPNTTFRDLLETEHKLDADVRARSRAEGVENNSYINKLKTYSNTRLYHCIIYLAPGDYHKFHSPTEWNMSFRRHFPGKLLAVNPIFTSWIKDLFCINERSVYIGEWCHGFFSMTAVGANNVGSIRVLRDPHLQTNEPTSRLLRGATLGWHMFARGKPRSSHSLPRLRQRYYDRKFNSYRPLSVLKPSIGPTFPSSSIRYHRGELFGEFNFGSTIVLIFEAPLDFEFFVASDQKVKMGQSLGDVVGPIRSASSII